MTMETTSNKALHTKDGITLSQSCVSVSSPAKVAMLPMSNISIKKVRKNMTMLKTTNPIRFHLGAGTLLGGYRFHLKRVLKDKLFCKQYKDV